MAEPKERRGLHRYDRWLYPGGRPRRLTHVINTLWAFVYGIGIMPRRLAALRVRGRRTGRTVVLPVVIADLEGERYLVAMFGERARWPHNVRAARGRAVLSHGRIEAVRLVEVDPADRAPILRRYLAVAPGARAHVPVARDASLEEFEKAAPAIPIFRITPAGGNDPG